MDRIDALVRVELVDERVGGDDAVAGGVPADDLLPRVDLLVEVDHGAVELDVHEHRVVLLVVRDGVGVLHLDDAVGGDGAEQSADHALLGLLAADVAAGVGGGGSIVRGRGSRRGNAK